MLSIRISSCSILLRVARTDIKKFTDISLFSIFKYEKHKFKFHLSVSVSFYYIFISVYCITAFWHNVCIQTPVPTYHLRIWHISISLELGLIKKGIKQQCKMENVTKG